MLFKSPSISWAFASCVAHHQFFNNRARLEPACRIYIKVITTSSPYNSANNGTVSSTGAVTSVQDMPDGQYSVSFFKTDSEDVEEGIDGGQQRHCV